ncbi:metal-dependent hydrolase family protein [Intestinimonas butyriciproducens]|uniref:metal-dependent hydrolase family protein n=1 Tax=Intestinimonas butyriciproducens TaxID=1297617 RepID=UPI00195A9C92|nr:amidohydrolase family protein [Intestinimonas butyriciproducens]MBM6919109.1 amidohydrolase family protein [Intestinimonas butyriciproducens]
MKKAVKCGKLFDSISCKVLEDKVVIIEDKTIYDVIDLREFAQEPDMEVIDLSDKFVTPGLTDLHVHSGMNGEGNDRMDLLHHTPAELTLYSLKNVQQDLYAGFTTLRDCGSQAFVSVALRDAINKGDFEGPRMFVSGYSLGSTGGHADSHYAPGVTCTAEEHPIIDGPDSARKAARFNLKNGADFLKFMSTGGVMSKGTTLGAQQLCDDEIAAIIEIANLYGVHTATHAHGTNGIKAAVRAGVTTVEHGMILDEEAIQLMLEHGTYLTPTIIAAERICVKGPEMGLTPWMVEKANQALSHHEWGFRQCLERGVPITFGTDSATPYNYHGKQGYEFELLQRFGMDPHKALVAATMTNAKVLGVDKTQGSVEKGKVADLCAWSCDPMEDVKTMQNCLFVMKEGVVVKH